MDGFGSAGETTEFVSALRALVAPGVYTAELESSPLIDLPAVTARAGKQAAREVRARVFITVLETVIRTRLSRSDQAAASILFGLGDWSGVPVRERHHAVARLRNKHWTWERNYRKEPLTHDLLTVLRALLREADAQAPRAGTDVGDVARREADYHLRRLGRRRTAYPLDMSLEQLQDTGLIIPVRLGRYHEHRALRRLDRQSSGLAEVVRNLEEGKSVLLLGEPGAGKTLAMYQLAIVCAGTGLVPVPVRAREATDVLDREGWRDIWEAERVVVLVDGLDEAADAIAHSPDRFAGQLRELLSLGPYVVSSRVHDYEELISSGFPDLGFDVVYVIESWTREAEFREYLSRLETAGLLNDPALYEVVVGSQDLTRLVCRPLYARMLTFVGEQAARGLHDRHALYGEYLTKLARVTDHALESQGHPAGVSALKLWQSTAWIIHSDGAIAGDLVSLTDVERMLTSPLPPPAVRRVLDQIIERGSWHGRETGEFIHYSFYEYLVAREVCDRIARNPVPARIVEVLSRDLPREIRHYLIGQLRVTGDASLRTALLSSYESARRVLDLPEHARLWACSMLIYLISRVSDGCTDWLRGQLADEQDLFLRQAILWAMCHVGSDWALREFFSTLETDAATRSVCRGWTLYYYAGDLPRDAGPPYRDDHPATTRYMLTYRRLIDEFTQMGNHDPVAPQRRFIDLYIFLDIIGTREVNVMETDRTVIRKETQALRSAGLPASLLARLAEMAACVGISQ
jgi:hypothetical protein